MQTLHLDKQASFVAPFTVSNAAAIILCKIVASVMKLKKSVSTMKNLVLAKPTLHN
jgi:hypothetical protein